MGFFTSGLVFEKNINLNKIEKKLPDIALNLYKVPDASLYFLDSFNKEEESPYPFTSGFPEIIDNTVFPIPETIQNFIDACKKLNISTPLTPRIFNSSFWVSDACQCKVADFMSDDDDTQFICIFNSGNLQYVKFIVNDLEIVYENEQLSIYPMNTEDPEYETTNEILEGFKSIKGVTVYPREKNYDPILHKVVEGELSKICGTDISGILEAAQWHDDDIVYSTVTKKQKSPSEKDRELEELVLRIKDTLNRPIENNDRYIEHLLSKHKYSSAIFKVTDFCKNILELTMLNHRFDKDADLLITNLNLTKQVKDKLFKIYNARISPEGMASKNDSIGDKKTFETFYFAYIFCLLILNKSKDIDDVLTIYNSNIVKDTGMSIQNYLSKFLAYTLENKKTEFNALYQEFEKEKKDKCDEAETIYYKMFDAILNDNSDLLQESYSEAAEKFKKRKSERFWDDLNILDGGGSSNDLSYDYLGTVALCLASKRNMNIKLNDEYNDFYPRAIIES